MAEQLSLLRSAHLPFTVRRRSIGWAARRALLGYVAAMGETLTATDGFRLRELAEKEALLAEYRKCCKGAARDLQGRPAARAAAFASSPAGRRVYRRMDELSARIAVNQEQALCG